MWYLRLVESCVVISGEYIKEKFIVDRFVDIILLIWDMINWIKGCDILKCFRLGK